MKRTEFMPFALVVMAEHADQCFHHGEGAGNTAHFRTIIFDCPEWMAETSPGVVRVDNTARPQLVSEADNPSMYKILVEYCRLSGLTILINTSFNMHKEPLVCTPYDATRAFKVGNLDYLATRSWIAKDPNPVERTKYSEKFEPYLNRQGVVKI